MKRAMSGQLPLMAAIKRVMDEVMEPPGFDAGGDVDQPLGREAAVLSAAKKITLFSTGVASQRFMTALADEQEVMADLCEMIMQVFALESAWLRALKLVGGRKELRGDCRGHDGLARGRVHGLGRAGGTARFGGLQRRRHAADTTRHSAAVGAVYAWQCRGAKPDCSAKRDCAGTISALDRACHGDSFEREVNPDGEGSLSMRNRLN